MQIEIWTIGKKHQKDLEASIKKYTDRLKHYIKFEWKIIEPSKSKSKTQCQQEESTKLKKLMNAQDRYIILDERGKSWDNDKWVAELKSNLNHNPGKLVIIIGGAYGFDDAFRQGQQLVSLSPLILPHQLVRLVMIEQLYRDFSIIHGGSYHHL